jgi:hypothetical protein
MSTIVSQFSKEFELHSANAVVAGFSFASALAWMDLVRWLISKVLTSGKNNGMSLAITAVMTTILSILVFMLVSRVSRAKVEKPKQPIYAVTV